MSTEPDTNAIIQAARAAVTADERCFVANAISRGVEAHTPYAVDVTGKAVYLKEAVDAAERLANLQAPLRVGQYTFGDIKSLLAWVETYKTENTVAFVEAPVDQLNGSITVQIDGLPKAGPHGSNHHLGAKVSFGLSPELLVWEEESDTWLTPEEFHAFVDEHVEEMTSAEVLTMAQNLEVSSESNWKRTVEPNGSVRLMDESKSGPKTSIPKRFGFSAPVFSLDDPDNLKEFDCTLRMKMESKKPLFQYEIRGFQRSINAATLKLVEQVGRVCPTFLGAR